MSSATVLEGWAWGVAQEKSVPPRAAYALVRLCQCYSGKHRNYLQLRRLAAELKTSPENMRRTLRLLKNAGMLSVLASERRPGEQEYVLHPPAGVLDEPSSH